METINHKQWGKIPNPIKDEIRLKRLRHGWQSLTRYEREVEMCAEAIAEYDFEGKRGN